MGIELFLFGVFFGLALGVVLGRLHRTNEEIELLDETERMRKIMKHQNLIITEQRINLKRYKDGKVLLTHDDQKGGKA